MLANGPNRTITAQSIASAARRIELPLENITDAASTPRLANALGVSESRVAEALKSLRFADLMEAWRTGDTLSAPMAHEDLPEQKEVVPTTPALVDEHPTMPAKDAFSSIASLETGITAVGI